MNYPNVLRLIQWANATQGRDYATRLLSKQVRYYYPNNPQGQYLVTLRIIAELD